MPNASKDAAISNSGAGRLGAPQLEATPLGIDNDRHASELEALIRSLQPDIILNDRLPGVGDYATPEQFIPSDPPSRRWETCLTMNRSWGWNPDDHDYKSSRFLLHSLCEVAGRGGNLLLNVSPRGDGSLPPEQIERLEDIGSWISSHREAIWATTPGLGPAQFYGPSTKRGDTIYLILLMRPYDTIEVRDIAVKRVQSVRDLGTGRVLQHRKTTGLIEGLTPDPTGTLTIAVPADVIDPYATVIEVEVAPLA
ncbi:MAG: alpha-L-fucosidase [Actinobacteria bacterium]|nr:alpha-L-fucosidase [Actinomycetota bacterium]